MAPTSVRGTDTGSALDAAVPLPTTADTTRRGLLDRHGWQRTRGRDGTAIGWCRTPPTALDGERDPVPVVFSNGIACSIDYWAEIAPAVAAKRPVVLWDYRGHGVSGEPVEPAACAVADFVDDLEAVLHAAAVQRAVFVGHSFGVQVGLEYARRRPGRVAATVAVAGAGGQRQPRATERRPLAVLGLLAQWHAQDPHRVDEAWRAWWRSPLTHLAARAIGGTSLAAPPTVMRAYYEHLSNRDVPLMLAMMREVGSHDASDVVPTLDTPVLALAGDADRVTPLPAMTRLALDARDGELAVCHGATHTLPIEHPRWVLDHLLALLDTVDREHDAPPIRTATS